MLALVDAGTQPKRMSLREMLTTFIQFRSSKLLIIGSYDAQFHERDLPLFSFLTIRRRTAFQLTKLTTRAHVVEGMLKALKQIDKVIDLVKKAKDSAAAKELLMSKKYGFTAEQADSILGLTLRRLTAMEDAKLKQEMDDLQLQIVQLNNIMEDDAAVNEIIIAESETIKVTES